MNDNIERHVDTEVWYAIEVSLRVADDWFAHTNQTYDTIERARAALQREYAQVPADCKLRLVKKTITTEVVKELE